MKNILFLLVLLTKVSFAHAQTVTSDSIQVLKLNKEILSLKTKINKIQLKLADQVNKSNKLKAENVKLNAEATKATDESKKLSSTADANVADETVSRKVSRAADKALAANKKVSKNVSELATSDKKIFGYNYDLQTLNAQLKKIDPVSADMVK